MKMIGVPFTVSSGNIGRAEIFGADEQTKSIGIFVVWLRTPTQSDASEYDAWASQFYDDSPEVHSEINKDREDGKAAYQRWLDSLPVTGTVNSDSPDSEKEKGGAK
jgi:hypothetical protein